MAQPAILVRTDPDDDRDWRRFVAVLCFIEFYSKFVSSGSEAWQCLHPEALAHATLDPSRSLRFFELCAEMLRACAFFLLGRSLWKRTRHATLSIVAAVATSIISILLCAARAWAGQDPYFSMNRIIGFWPKTREVFGQELDQFMWIVVFIIALRLRRRVPSGQLLLNGWVVVAIGWCLARLIVDCGVLSLNPMARYFSVRTTGLSQWMEGGLARGINEPKWMAPVALLSPLGLAALLIARKRVARWAALIVLCLDATPILTWALEMPLLNYVAIQALYNALPNSTQNPFSVPRLLLNQSTFQWLCVDLVGIVGPWYLIAWYAGHKPMTQWPNDGSPWPRRYCGKCVYNLHGVEAGRCPECGTVICVSEPASIDAGGVRLE